MKTVRFSEHCSSLPHSTSSLIQAWRCLAVRDILRPGEDGNEPLSCRTPRCGMGFSSLYCFHDAQPRAFRLQGGEESSQSEDERILEGMSQACMSSATQEAAREPEGLATALLTAWEKKDFCEIF